MTQDKTIILHTFNDLQEATLAQDKLKANGIDSFLEDQNPVGINPLGGVELKIFLKDKETAEKIIAE
jgi:Putative prokaryotic signal transducing protein